MYMTHWCAWHACDMCDMICIYMLFGAVCVCAFARFCVGECLCMRVYVRVYVRVWDVHVIWCSRVKIYPSHWLICMWHDALTCVTWLIDMCDMIDMRVTCVTWYVYRCYSVQPCKYISIIVTYIYVHDSLICVTCVWHVWHDMYIHVIRCSRANVFPSQWLICMWHDALTCVTWLIDMCDMMYIDTIRLYIDVNRSSGKSPS